MCTIALFPWWCDIWFKCAVCFRSPASCSSVTSQSGSSSTLSGHCDRRRGASWEAVLRSWKAHWNELLCQLNLDAVNWHLIGAVACQSLQEAGCDLVRLNSPSVPVRLFSLIVANKQQNRPTSRNHGVTDLIPGERRDFRSCCNSPKSASIAK